MERNMLAMNSLPRNLKDSNSFLCFWQTYIGARENLRAMQNPFEVDNVWVYIIMQQFDNDIRRRFEDFLGWQGATRIPTFAALDRFVLYELNVQKSFEDHEPLPGLSQRKNDKNTSQQKVRTFATSEETPKPVASNDSQRLRKCLFCNSEKHRAIECDELKADDRDVFVKKHKGCIYCVKHKYDHKRPCRSRPYLKCNICQEQHVTEMHPNRAETTTTLLAKTGDQRTSNVILPTVIASIMDHEGNGV